MRNVFSIIMCALCAALLSLHVSALAQTAVPVPSKQPCESSAQAGVEVSEGQPKMMIDDYNAHFGDKGVLVLCALTGSADFSSTSVMYSNYRGSALLVVWINRSLAAELDPRIVPFIMVREMARASNPVCTLETIPEYLACESLLDRFALQSVGGAAITALEIMEQAYRKRGSDTLLAIVTGYRATTLREYVRQLASRTK